MEFAYRTDIGQKRPNNEDYVGLFTNRGQAMLAIVADGMGGHQGGDVASEMAVSHIATPLKTPPPPTSPSWCGGWSSSCNRKTA